MYVHKASHENIIMQPVKIKDLLTEKITLTLLNQTEEIVTE